MQHDLIIIGAGPAGMAAAIETAAQGLSVVLLDEQTECGGQIYRSITSTVSLRPDNLSILGTDYTRGQHLTNTFRQANIDYRPSASVWNLDPFNGKVCYSKAGDSHTLSGKRFLIAGGAIERPCPIPGWTLPGVMSAGSAQALLKSAGMIPSGPTVLAGCGPLLLLTAAQLNNAGVKIAGVIETTSWKHYLASTSGLLQALAAPEYLLKGMKIRHQLRRAQIPIYTAAHQLEAIGKETLEAVRFYSADTCHTIPAANLFLHTGVIPNTSLSRQVGIEHEWCSRQQYWQPIIHQAGCTSNPSVFVAGDGASILGARAAEKSGHIVALNIACESGAISSSTYKTLARRHKVTRWRHSTIRPFLDTLFAPPAEETEDFTKDTFACRCYEVSHQTVIDAVRAGCNTPDQIKSLLRCGMGPCQGRMCATTIATIIATARNIPKEEVGVYRARPPVKPITLSELASLNQDRAE